MINVKWRMLPTAVLLLAGALAPGPARAEIAACMCACGHHLSAPCGPADCMDHVCSQHGNCPSGGGGGGMSPELFFIQQLANMAFSSLRQESQRKRLLELDAAQAQANLAAHRQKLLAERDQLLRQLIGPKYSQTLKLKPMGAAPAEGLKLKPMNATAEPKPARPPADPGLARARMAADCLLDPLLSRKETRPLASEVRGGFAKALRELSAKPPSGERDAQTIYTTSRDAMIRAGDKELQFLLKLDLHRKEGTGVLVVDMQYAVKDFKNPPEEGQGIVRIAPSGQILERDLGSGGLEMPAETEICLGP